jgi:hypothetical protein
MAITIIFILQLIFLLKMPKLASQHITKKKKGVNYLFHNLMETLNPNQCIENLNPTRVQLSCGHFLSTTKPQVSNNGYPVDGAWWVLWFTVHMYFGPTYRVLTNVPVQNPPNLELHHSRPTKQTDPFWIIF